MKSKFVQKKIKHLSFLVILFGILFISGCISQNAGKEAASAEVPETTTDKTTLDINQNLPQEPLEAPATIDQNAQPIPPETFNVNISDLNCQWTVKTDQYGNKSDCVRIISKGMAQGPVKTRVELPILSWSEDKFDCGAWTHKTGALAAVGHTCVREEGQPETTTWIVDTEGNECPIKNYFNNNRTHSVKIYNNIELKAEKEDSKSIQ